MSRFQKGDLVQVVVPQEVLRTKRLLRERSRPVRFERYLELGDPAWSPIDDSSLVPLALVNNDWTVDASCLEDVIYCQKCRVEAASSTETVLCDNCEEKS